MIAHNAVAYANEEAREKVAVSTLPTIEVHLAEHNNLGRRHVRRSVPRSAYQRLHWTYPYLLQQR
jgi:hypothetical protein